MKACSKCKINKNINNFCKSSKNKDGLQSWCKECVSSARMKRYYENYDLERSRGNERNKKAYINNMRKIFSILEKNVCVDCGESDPIVLDFDHNDPLEKNFNISESARKFYNFDKIQKEIDKCTIRCSNCHRRKTAKENNWYKWIN